MSGQTLIYRVKQPYFIGLAIIDAMFLMPLHFGNFKITTFLVSGVVSYFVLALLSELFRKVRPDWSRKFEFMSVAVKIAVLFYFFRIYIRDPHSIQTPYVSDNSGLGIFSYRGYGRAIAFLYSVTIVDFVWLITTACQIVVVGIN